MTHATEYLVTWLAWCLTYIALDTTERHVINHGSIEKNLLFKKTRNSPPATSFYSSLSLLLPRNREKKEKKEKKSRGKRSRDVLLISFLLSKIDVDIFTSTRYFPAFLRLLWNITMREESLERRERNWRPPFSTRATCAYTVCVSNANR